MADLDGRNDTLASRIGGQVVTVRDAVILAAYPIRGGVCCYLLVCAEIQEATGERSAPASRRNHPRPHH
jgi:hypothetical protein